MLDALQVCLPVSLVAEDIASMIAPGDQVIQSALKFNSGFAAISCFIL
jgi:hypothetical protein